VAAKTFQRSHRYAVIAIVAATAISAAGTASATLLTSEVGYTGPTLDIGIYANNPFVRTGGPLLLPGGITYSSEYDSSVIGTGFYGFGGNGEVRFGNIIGSNSFTAAVTLTFAIPVESFGTGFNYITPIAGLPQALIGTPFLSAYDSSNNLIATYDLLTLAPISTQGIIDSFAFRGIDGDGTLIKSFTFKGAGLAAFASPFPTFSASEPPVLPLFATGLGLMGWLARRKRRQHQPEGGALPCGLS
jgi:hypothetical protein